MVELIDGLEVYDIVSEIERWRAFQWPSLPRSTTGAVSDQSAEKLTCMQLAHYPVLYAQWQELFG